MNAGMEKKSFYTVYQINFYLLCRFITLAFIHHPELITGKILISAERDLTVRNGEGISDESIITDEVTDMNKRTE